MAAALPQPSKKKFTFPTAFTILFILLIVIAPPPGSFRPARMTTTRTVSRSRARIIRWRPIRRSC